MYRCLEDLREWNRGYLEKKYLSAIVKCTSFPRNNMIQERLPFINDVSNESRFRYLMYLGAVVKETCLMYMTRRLHLTNAECISTLETYTGNRKPKRVWES